MVGGGKATAGPRVGSHAMSAPPRRRPVPIVALATVLSVLLGACTSGDPSAGPSTEAGRIEAVRSARELVVEPAQALGTAAAEVAARLDTLVQDPAEPAVDSGAGRPTRTSSPPARRWATSSSTPRPRTSQAAAGALEDASAGADQLDRAAEEVAAAADEAIAVAEALDEIVTAWDEPGSRSQLLARFDELAAQADGLTGRAPSQACPGPVEEAVDAAEFVAETTRELRELVAQYDGNAFDDRREELHDAPYGTTDAGDPRAPGTAIDTEACPAVEEARSAAGDVAAALRELQQALNPSDLES